MPLEFTAPAAGLARVIANGMLFACKDDTLPVLCTVRVEVDGQELTAVATDRYTISRETLPVTDARGYGETPAFHLALGDAKNLVAFLKTAARAVRAPLPVSVAYDDESGKVTFDVQSAGAVAYPVYFESDRFPRWRSLYNHQSGERSEVTFNAAYLARFTKVDGDFPRGQAPEVTLHMGSAGKPVRVTVGPNFEGLIVPIRKVD